MDEQAEHADPGAASDDTGADAQQVAFTTEQRKYGRLRPGIIRSSLGPVLDISPGGMRLLSTRELEGEHVVALYDYDDLTVTVETDVVWCKRLGFRRYLVGFAFGDLTPPMRKKIAKLSTVGRLDPED